MKNDDQTNDDLNLLNSNRAKMNTHSSIVDTNCYLPSQPEFKDYIDFNDYIKIFGIEENQREQDNKSNYS